MPGPNLSFLSGKHATVSPMLNAKHIRRRFENAASSFDDADFVHGTTRDGLLARLEPLLVDGGTVVDLGAATGAANKSLEKRFRSAHVISVDIAHNMLDKGRNKKSWLSKTSFAQADASALPLQNECIDVVFSNMLLPWVVDPTPVFAEVARVLKKGGVFAFATLGPDSLLEISRAWSAADGDVHVEMTLTAPGCGMGPYIAQQAEWRIAEIDDVEDVQVDVVFDPPWTPDMITEDGKRLLGID